MNSTANKFFCLTAVISIAACLALMATRGFDAISFVEPLQVQTRGAEYESLYPIWKYINGLTLYSDLTRIPFAATYYNWLYYVSYGWAGEAILSLFSLDDAWLPTIIRLTTLTGACAGAAFMYASIVRLSDIREPVLRFLVAGLTISVFLGPLLGYWALTTTPDVWPVVAAAVAVVLFMRHYEDYPLAATLMVCGFSYVSWAFKQNFIYIPTTISLFLLLRRDWKNAAILMTVMCSAGIVTLILGGPVYRDMLFGFGATQWSMSFDQMFINVSNMSVKTAPILIGAMAVVLAFSLLPELRFTAGEAWRRRSPMMVPYLGVVIAAVESMPTSSIIAAAENHFFHLIFFLAFATLLGIGHMPPGSKVRKMVLSAVGLGFLANAAAIGTVFAGLQGILSVRPLHDLLVAERDCLVGLSRSIFVDDRRLMLPWMVPANEHFVLEFSYFGDRANGVEFEGGGVGGLIDNGYFDVVAIRKPRNRRFDGSDLSHYTHHIRTCGTLEVYRRTKVRE